MKRDQGSIGKWTAVALGKLWVGFLVGVIVGVGVGAYWTMTRETEYRATTVYYLRPPITTDATEALTADIYAFNRAKLYSSLMTSTQLADRVSKRIKSGTSAAQLSASITATDIYQTSLITTTVSANSGDAALLIARAYAAELPGYAGRVEKDSGLENAGALITAVDGPRLSSSGPGGLPVIAAAALVFALLGTAVSWWYRRKYLANDAVAISSLVGISVYSELNPNDHPSMDRMLARIMAEPDTRGHLTLVGPHTDDGAEVIADALAEAGDRLDVSVRSGIFDARAALFVTCRAVLDETPASRIKSKGPQLLVVRQYVTSQRSLLAAVRILTANESHAPLGIVVIKRSSVGSKLSPVRRAHAAEEQNSTEMPAVPVRT